MTSNTGDSTSQKQDPFSWILPKNPRKESEDTLEQAEDVTQKEPVSEKSNNFENWFMPKKQHQQPQQENRQQFTNSFMFGKRRQVEDKPENWLENINMLEMMEHADTLIAYFAEIKPIFKKIPSLFASFKKK